MSVMLALLLLSPLPVLQDEFDPVYTEQFNRYNEIGEMTDPGEKAAADLDFFESGVDQRLFDFVVGRIGMSIQEVIAAANYDAVYPLVDRFADVHPPALATCQLLGLDAALKAGNAGMIVKYGEPVYEQNKDPQFALILTQAFGQLNNEAKMIQYGRITVDSGAFPLSDVFNIAYTVLQYDAREGQREQAVALAEEIRAEVTTVPEGISADDWDTIQLYMLDLIARSDFDARRWSEAIESLDEILTLDPRNDKAWYLKGNAMLQIGARPNDAALALAKAVVIEGNYQRQARTLLESIAASNAPPGAAAVNQYIEEKLAQARRELGQ